MQVFAKIRGRRNSCQYRKILSINETIYENINSLITDCVDYNPNTQLEGMEQWYKIENFHNKPYYNSELEKIEESSVAYSLLERNEWDVLTYVFFVDENYIYFQSIRKSMFIRKKGIIHLGNNFKYVDKREELTINDRPDAIYNRNTKILYFQKLQSITKIFPGIEILYKEATNEEVRSFLQEEFIALRDGFNADKVKSLNRRRIALVKETLANLPEKKKKQAISYISTYCPELKCDDNTFEIASDKDLKYLLYGLQERFYTTPIGNEKRIANSIIPIE